MHTILNAMAGYLKDLFRQFVSGWNAFWFTPVDPLTLGCVRIATGVCLLYLYFGCLPGVLSYVGPQAWVDQQALQELREARSADPGIRYGWSAWLLADSPFKSQVLYYYFLAAIVCFTLGLYSRLANVLVWVGHLSFVHRSLITWYGADVVLSVLLFYMLWAPTGAAVSLDALWRNRSSPKGAANRTVPSWTANLSLRAIQVHMCIIYLCSGLAKLQGETWWDGSAIWYCLMIHELGPLDLQFLTLLDDRSLQVISTAGCFLTVAFEVSFVYLIWNPRLRPLLLALAVVLHGLIGGLMGLGAFSCVMLTGCLAFVAPTTLRWIGRHLLRKAAASKTPTFRLQGQASREVLASRPES